MIVIRIIVGVCLVVVAIVVVSIAHAVWERTKAK